MILFELGRRKKYLLLKQKKHPLFTVLVVPGLLAPFSTRRRISGCGLGDYKKCYPLDETLFFLKIDVFSSAILAQGFEGIALAILQVERNLPRRRRRRRRRRRCRRRRRRRGRPRRRCVGRVAVRGISQARHCECGFTRLGQRT